MPANSAWSDLEQEALPPGACPVCGSGDVHLFFQIAQVPVHCNLLWPDRKEAIAAPKGDVELAFCTACQHVFNRAFRPDLMQYTQDYENSLHFSPRFQEYAQALARRLVEQYRLYGKDIVEIGSGKGDFLKLLCELGGNRGLGFDPSYTPGPGDAGSEPVTFVPDFYSEQYTDRDADLIVCRHVLEHVEDPAGFVTRVRRGIGDRWNTAVYFEVPNMLYTLRQLGIWDIIYEHYSYFTAHSLAHLFDQCGFHAADERGQEGEAFAGQFLYIETFPRRDWGRPVQVHHERPTTVAGDVEAFGARYRRKVEAWRGKLEGMARTGQRAAVWGAGSKGVTFLNALQACDPIGHVVDINPRKQGMYVAGTGQPIVAPEVLKEVRPDVVIVMNPVYENEIRRRVGELGLAPDLICA